MEPTGTNILFQKPGNLKKFKVPAYECRVRAGKKVSNNNKILHAGETDIFTTKQISHLLTFVDVIGPETTIEIDAAETSNFTLTAEETKRLRFILIRSKKQVITDQKEKEIAEIKKQFEAEEKKLMEVEEPKVKTKSDDQLKTELKSKRIQ